MIPGWLSLVVPNLTTYYLLPTTYYLLPTTYYLLPTTYYVPTHSQHFAAGQTIAGLVTRSIKSIPATYLNYLGTYPSQADITGASSAVTSPRPPWHASVTRPLILRLSLSN